MAARDRAAFVSSIMLDIIDEVNGDLLVFLRWLIPNTLVDKSVVRMKLGHLKLLSILPASVAHFLVNGNSDLCKGKGFARSTRMETV